MADEVVIPSGLFVTSTTSGELTTPQGARLALLAMFPDAPGVVAGVEDECEVSESSSSMEYDIADGVVAGTRSGQGVYLLHVPATTVETDTADGSNPRVDIVYAVQHDEQTADSDSTAAVGVAVGTAASSPSDPDLPDGAVPLFRKVVPAGAAATDEGTAGSDERNLIRGNGPVEFAASAIISGTLDDARLPSIPSTKLPTVPVSKGGTGSTSAASARDELDVMQTPIVQSATPSVPATPRLWLKPIS